ncbi:metallophosphoesterase family protein [Methanolobus sp. ZRKC3]|uniref:metallophosphoesterase family protein n=1 Tax=Methanolobus sp. ZRKC3 TaxID=3125786 RepID=UPI003253F23A
MRILFISDIHGNKEALDAVLQVPHDEVFCLGDLADYGPSPAECIDYIMDNNIKTVLGNHDAAVGSGIDCGCGYKYKHLSTGTRDYTWDAIAEEHREFLRQLPFELKFECGGKKLQLVHGSPRSNYEYIKPETPEGEVSGMLAGMDADILLVGHSHIPFVRVVGGITIINPGSVGQSRDGDPRASCVVFDTGPMQAEIICCDYDIETTCRKIREMMPHSGELVAILRRGY